MKKCKLCNKELRDTNQSGFCKICYSRNYRKNNKEKIAPVSHKKYMRNRERSLEVMKEWQKNNKQRVNKKQNEYYHNNKERQLIRVRTQRLYGNLKLECQKCKSKENLQFHHPNPLSVDNFMVLCKKCHMTEHGKILSENNTIK